jgi:hypothetical protein
MKLSPDLAAIPPILLSCAMGLSPCTKKSQDGRGVEIVRVPDWGAIGYDDDRILQHPQHQKAVAWMADIGPTKNTEAVKVLEGGVDWQAILRDRRESLGQHQHAAGASTSHQLSKEVTVEPVAATHVRKPRSFGPATKHTANGKGQGIEQEKEGAELRKDNDEEVVTTNIPQPRSNERGRKRRRASYAGAEYVETSDDDFQMEGVAGSSNKPSGTIYVSRTPAASPPSQPTLEHAEWKHRSLRLFAMISVPHVNSAG